MAHASYIGVVERAGEGYSVFFPDVPGCVSAGDTQADAFSNAEAALALHLHGMVEDGQDMPAASVEIEHDPEVDEVCRFLARVELPGKTIRLNITLDEGLVASIDRVARNRSGFLAEAARGRLRELADA
jgi:predicted RNase H-like HicB family nuclease